MYLAYECIVTESVFFWEDGHMFRKIVLSGCGVAVALGTVSSEAAPVLPDIPQAHWAREATLDLIKEGLVKGYPDGRFEGAHAINRYEIATILARILTDKKLRVAQLSPERLTTLLESCRSRLKALGLHVDTLEERVIGYRSHAKDLEQTSFYGKFDTQVTMQSFRNEGSIFNDKATPVDLIRGRPLFNGTGLTMNGVLGIEMAVNNHWDIGGEIAAFASQGNGAIDPYWGLGGSYLNNWWTTGGIGNNDVFSHTPLSMLNLSSIWLDSERVHVSLGGFKDTSFSSIIYNNGQPNPSFYGAIDNGSYGVDLKHSFGLFGMSMDWELMLTKVPTSVRYPESGFPVTVDTEYSPEVALDSLAYGLNLGSYFDSGFFRLNYLRFQTDANESNYDEQILFSSGFAPQQFEYGSPVGGDLVGQGVYNANPNHTNIYGVEAGYDWDLSESFGLSFEGAYGHSESSLQPWGMDAFFLREPIEELTSDGDAWQMSLDLSLLEDSLGFGVRYLNVEGSFDPVSIQYPMVGGHIGLYQPYPFISRGASQWFLHDTEQYPHNRKGYEVNAEYKFSEGKGRVWGQYKNLDQVDAFGEALFYDPVFRSELDDGNVQGFEFSLSYDFGRLGFQSDYEAFDYTQASSVTDMTASLISIELDYDLASDLNLFGGISIAEVSGRYNFISENLDHKQVVPYMGFGYVLSDGASFDLDFRYFTTSGNGVGAPGLIPVTSLGVLENPVEFSGLQVNTTFSVMF